MILALSLYAAITVLLALVDHLRRKAQMGKVANISHEVSVVAAIVGAMGVWAIVFGKHIDWHLVPYLIGCVGVRLLLFDPTLNLFNRERFDQVSTTTSSYKDQHSEKVGFYWQRAIGAGIILLSLLLNHWIG